MIDHESLEEFRDAQTYDMECDAFDEDYPLLEQWAQSIAGPLLDLACGTGRMALHLAAQGYQITGVDIVPEMIARARQKMLERAVSVEWIVSDACTFHTPKRFSGVYMLMNAFQFFLTRADQEAMLARVQEHLQPNGYFLFETRNPSLQNLNELRHPQPQKFTTADGRELMITEQQHYDPLTQIQHYTRYYQWLYADGQRLEETKRTALRYVFPQEMELLLFYNGFQIVACYGDWALNPFTAASPAMIYICQKRD